MEISEAINIQLLLTLSQAIEKQDWKQCCFLIEQQIERCISNRARNSLENKLRIYKAIAAGKI
jgi:hypothetical protein